MFGSTEEPDAAAVKMLLQFENVAVLFTSSAFQMLAIL